MEAVFLAPAVDVVDDQQPTVGQINGAGAPKARTSRRNTSRRTGRSRAVVLEHDLDVVARTQVLPPPELLSAFLNQHRPRFVLLKYPLDSIDERLMAACLEYRARILVLAQPTYGLLSPNRLYRLGGLPWIRLSRGSAHPAADRAKRCIDVALTLQGGYRRPIDKTTIFEEQIPSAQHRRLRQQGTAQGHIVHLDSRHRHLCQQTCAVEQRPQRGQLVAA